MANEENDFTYDPSVNYDEDVMALQRQIEKEVADNAALMGAPCDFSLLAKEYEGDDVYTGKVEDLCSKYKSMRRTRGDGNCFYRAFGFAHLERLLNDAAAMKQFKALVADSKDKLIEQGFPKFTLEDFHDTFMEVLEKVESGCGLTELEGIFNDAGYSDYLVVYLRILVSGHLQKEADFFMNFIDGGRSVKEFCSQEVEPMGREADHIHIIALTAALDTPVRVEYMDRGESKAVNAHDFPEGSAPQVCLLYRPGHYDILYK